MSIEDLKIINDMEKGWVRGNDQPLWHRRIYDMWKNMWNRCRNPKHKKYKNYKDCKIHEDFRFLSNFVDWIISEPRFEEFCNTCDKISWCIDKDMKYVGNRNYYPEYMTLTTLSENSKEMINRRGNPNPKVSVIAISDNKVLLFKSVHDAQDKGFRHGCIKACIDKLPYYKTHKGYKWYRINYKHNKIYRRS